MSPAQVPARALAWIGDLVERRPIPGALALLALTLATHVIVLAAPGFYSNDEWQKFDYLRLHGGWDFVLSYGALRPGPEFGFPVRPLGFMQQGFAALWMQSAPWASHLVGILNHALVALAFVWVLRRAGFAGVTAGLAGILFVISPLTTMGAGWPAASFDQLYVLFLLLAAAAIVRVPADGISMRRAAWMVLATTAALLAKETAIVAPGVVLLIAYLTWAANPMRFAWHPFAMAFLAVLLPVVAYLLFRAPAIATSFAGHADPAYTPDSGNAFDNAWHFLAFPFRLKLVEISAAVFRSPWQPLAATAAHLLLIAALVRSFGARFATAYVAGYFIFLLPVLMLPNPGVHCLYGAALTMSQALAAILERSLAARHLGLAALLLTGAGALFAHDLAIQRHLYNVGGCQSRFLASVDTLLAQRPPGIVVIPDPGASLRVAIRAVSAREPYVANGQPVVTFDAPDPQAAVSPVKDALRARMTAACVLRPETAPAP
jgi:hypothetical protein